MNTYIDDETRKQLARWTNEHSIAASAEGWNMFDYNSMGLLEIERCDESDVFSTDQEAIDFIRLRASAGDPKAVLALELDHYFQPIIDRVRAANDSLNHPFGA